MDKWEISGIYVGDQLGFVGDKREISGAPWEISRR